MTPYGWAYAQDACSRYEDVHAELSAAAERWEAGTMTETERREAQVQLVLLAWERDHTANAEALADLRSQGFDPLSPKSRARMRDKGIDLPE